MRRYTLTIAALALAAQLSAQELAVSGKVTDNADGRALTGVRIRVVGDKATAMTDSTGTFSINVPDGRVTLQISAPRHNTIFVPLRKQQRLDIRLTEKSAVVTPLGQPSADRSVAELQGQLYSTQRSGQPGSGSSVLIDGLHSLTGSSQPLYVVDGVIWATNDDAISVVDGHVLNPLALISPDDIENIQVMRDGTAIWGAKGGNGVVLITTKRARNEATEIEAFARLGYRSTPKTIPMMNADEYRLYGSDIMTGGSTFGKNSSYNTDWLDLTTRNAVLMNYGISVRGGDDRALYGFSLGYTSNEGNVNETSFERLNIRFNSDINLWKGFKLRFDIAFAQATQQLRDDGINGYSSPYYMSLIKSPLYHPNVISETGEITRKYSDTDALGIGNPLSVLQLGKGEVRNYRFNLNAAPRYTFNDKFALCGLIGFSFDKDKENSFVPDYGTAERALLNNNGEIYAMSRNVVKSLMIRHTTLNADIHAEYTPLSGLTHNLAARLGYRFQNDGNNYSYGEGHNTSSDFMTDLSNTTSSLHFSDGLDSSWHNMAWYLSADYSYMQRYLLSLNMAMETSSRFGKNADGGLKLGGVTWGLFPSVDAAWLMSAENWMRGAKFINTLKLRAGLSVAGNDNLPDNATRTFFASNPLMGNAYGLVIANIGNDRLKWEQTTTLRAGIDATVWNNRLALSIDFFKATTKDLLMRRQLNEQAGLTYYWANGGDMDNTGFNIAASLRAIDKKDWKLDLGASVGHYKNEITKLDGGQFTTDICGGQVLTAVGGPAGVFYGYRTEGVFATSADAAAANLAIRNSDGSTTQFMAGDIHFYDKTADGIIDDADRVVIGDPNPDLYGNFNFKLSWRNLTLSSVFTYSMGNDVYNALRANLEAGSSLHNQTTAMLNRWVAEGQHTDIPRAVYGDPMGNSRFSDRWIEDGSFLRWSQLQLTWQLPLQSKFIQGLELSVAVNNLCTFTKYIGSDPEFAYGSSPLYRGVDAGLTPHSREFNFGVKINL